MVEKNENWSVNSGKWAYSKESSSIAEKDGKSSRRLALSAAVAAPLLAVGLATSVSLGWIRFPFDLLGALVDPTPRSDGTTGEARNDYQAGSNAAQLQAENQRLREELAQQKQLADDRQRIIDQQNSDLDSASSRQIPSEYSIVKRARSELYGQRLTISAEHQFEGSADHWVRAACSVSPTVSGVSYSVELLKRDQPDFDIKAGITSSETLREAGLLRPDIVSLGASCPWLDDKRYSEEEIANVLPADIAESSLASPGEGGTDVRSKRQIFPTKDMVGMDIQTLTQTSQSECEAVCVNDRRCTAYTYDNWNRLCITKSGIGKLRMEPRSTTVLFSADQPSISALKPTMTARRDRAFPDRPYGFALTSSYDACANLCLAELGCLGVNFVRSLGQCQFFAEPSEYQPSSGVTLGYKSQLQ